MTFPNDEITSVIFNIIAAESRLFVLLYHIRPCYRVSGLDIAIAMIHPDDKTVSKSVFRYLFHNKILPFVL